MWFVVSLTFKTTKVCSLLFWHVVLIFETTKLGSVCFLSLWVAQDVEIQGKLPHPLLSKAPSHIPCLNRHHQALQQFQFISATHFHSSFTTHEGITKQEMAKVIPRAPNITRHNTQHLMTRNIGIHLYPSFLVHFHLPLQPFWLFPNSQSQYECSTIVTNTFSYDTNTCRHLHIPKT